MSASSDDENHHCVDCGRLVWEEHCTRCERCAAYWCNDYQHTFIFPNCETVECREEMLCAECFLADPAMWCADEQCLCNCKRATMQNKYAEWKANGSWFGEVRLRKDAVLWRASLYRFNGEARTRLVVDKQEMTFADRALAVAHAQQAVREQVQQGFVLDSPTSVWDTNPWGDLASLEI